MLLIYRRRPSTGARDLAEGILMQGVRCRRTRGRLLRENFNPAENAVICWGEHVALPANARALNNVPAITKFQEAQRLAQAGVPTVQVSEARPIVVAARPAYIEQTMPIMAQSVGTTSAQELVNRLTNFIAQERARRQEWERQPAVPAETWLPRRNNHVGGNDLLTENLQDADFWSKKETIIEEYRVHMFKGKSIRAGKKIQRPTRPDGRTAPHQWIRSYDAGWVIQYDNFESTREMRELAKRALEALGLDFGAVDIGRKQDGSLIVLEVNRAPGIEGGTVEAYARHIINWFRGNNAE